ncbi:MAG: MarR family transcriptional regulator [Dehalococcoidia bacterium]|nr:MarR family transcriptional regulator [Dehalococcoidia bacterium]
MKPLELESIPGTSLSDCSAQLLDVVPLIMRRIRREMRRHSMPGLSVAQFRTLIYLQRHPGTSLSEVSDFLGLTNPSASKLVDRLVMDKAVSRRIAQDRRRISLSLTERGQTALELARLEARNQLADSLKELSPEDLATVTSALDILDKAFSPVNAIDDHIS